MKDYTCLTRFGAVVIRSKGLHELSEEAPYTIINSRSKISYNSVLELLNGGQKKKLKNKRTAERFMVMVWYRYIRYAIQEMIENNAKIPITQRGYYLAIGVNRLASARKDYKFNPKTLGIVYEPVIVHPSKRARRIKFHYRVRLHKRMIHNYGDILESGKVYEKQPKSYLLEKVNTFYEQRLNIRIKKKFNTTKDLRYAIRL